MVLRYLAAALLMFLPAAMLGGAAVLIGRAISLAPPPSLQTRCESIKNPEPIDREICASVEQ